MIKTVFMNPVNNIGMLAPTVGRQQNTQPLQIAFICITLAQLIDWFCGYHGLFISLNALFYPLLPDSVWQGITVLGDSRITLALSLLFVYRYSFILPATLLATIPALIFSQGVKALFDADRPAAVLDIDSFHHIGHLLNHHSFPSGHSTTIGVFIAMMLYISTQRWQRIGLIVLLFLVGFSRVAVGVHWPVDVMTGLALGLASGYWGLKMVSKYRFATKKYHYWILIALPVYAAISVLFSDYSYTLCYQFMIAISMTALLFYLYELLLGSWTRWSLSRQK